ncbi:hypothetical protein ACT009_13695 [Sphingomonas sp. Tas61C01]|uniref:hypothetical protein n=1 Tax=Sphingomonas sp. Tas61C01 TaxID=3458297 RepID=UPI00403E52C3
MTDRAGLSPRTLMTVGVTGHRLQRLGVENIGAVEASVEAILVALEDAAGLADRGDLRLITSLAEGADAIAADAAVARDWRLDVVLPFAREIYAHDFPPGEARAAYDARLDACSAIMELNSDRDAPGGDGLAYERAGRIVLAQSDLIIAIWDGEIAWGRGGAAQIVAEAVIRGIPVIHVDPKAADEPRLLWDRLHPIDRGQQTVDSVARSDLSALPGLVAALVTAPVDPRDRERLSRFEAAMPARRWSIAIAYSLLLAMMGVRGLRRSDIDQRFDADRAGEPIAALCATAAAFGQRIRSLLAVRFAQADVAATRAAQTFRSVYVANFALAALAVVLSLSSLALPGAKPALLVLELLAIGTILLQTHAGRRRDWHRRWLDNRQLAERLRCLAISAQLGDLDLRNGRPDAGWADWYVRATAREVGLPMARVDAAYLDCVRASLVGLLDDQIAYLGADARRMHHLEHRLHRLGTWLFMLTAFACVAMFAVKMLSLRFGAAETLAYQLGNAATIIGAALPAIGAAIYGIRMQGDFSGTAARSRDLRGQLTAVRDLLVGEPLTFDTLAARTRRVTGLLTSDVMSWIQTYEAKPLALPG